jgi:cobalt-zinc-cadmium resistance protein CzcA
MLDKIINFSLKNNMIVLPLLFKIFQDGEGLKYKFMKIFKSKIFILPFLLLISGTIAAQSPAYTYTLEQCIDVALKNNKEIGAYNLKIEERKALAKPFMSADKANVYYNYDEMNPDDNGYTLHVVGVEQSFSFPTTYYYMNKMEDLEVNMAEYELKKQQFLLMKNVASAYYSVQFLEVKKRYYTLIDSLYARFNAMSETQLQAGDISHLDRLNSRVKGEQIALEINQINIEIQNAYSNLKALMQSDEQFRVADGEMGIVVVNQPDFQSNPEIQQHQLRSQYLKLNTKSEQQQLLPDIILGYFYGTNFYTDAQGYHGVEVGVGIPLFWGGQRAKIKASKFATHANELLLQNNLIILEAKYKSLQNELEKYRKIIEFYNHTGKQLSEEITRTAIKSYEAGDIDFYLFTDSMVNALSLILDYYEAVLEYNRVALEINYLTIE